MGEQIIQNGEEMMIKALNAFQPKGDIVEDLRALEKIRGGDGTLYDLLYDRITGKQNFNPDDPDSAYNYLTDTYREELRAEHDDPRTAANVSAFKRIISAYEANHK